MARRAAALTLVGLFLGCGHAGTTAEGCTRLWNDQPPPDVVPPETEIAVYTWTDKAGDEGCGILLVSGLTGEWALYSQVPDRSSGWATVRGSAWGQDSPEGCRTTSTRSCDATGPSD